MSRTVFTFARMNPPTQGHQRVVNRMKAENEHHTLIFLSRNEKTKRNPLPFETKKDMVYKAFDIRVVDTEWVTDALLACDLLYAQGVRDIVYVAGGDRVAEMEKKLNLYNGRMDRWGGMGYHFNTIEVLNAGERESGIPHPNTMSATLARETARAGDLDTFAAMLPVNLSHNDAEVIYREIRETG